MKVLVALIGLSMALVGCSAKADVGDANVQVAPGTAKAPSAPMGAGGGGGVATTGAGGPSASVTAPAAPK